LAAWGHSESLDVFLDELFTASRVPDGPWTSVAGRTLLTVFSIRNFPIALDTVPRTTRYLQMAKDCPVPAVKEVLLRFAGSRYSQDQNPLLLSLVLNDTGDDAVAYRLFSQLKSWFKLPEMSPEWSSEPGSRFIKNKAELTRYWRERLAGPPVARAS
jgi:hypothetical protein